MFSGGTNGYSLADIAAATGGGNRNSGGWGDSGAWWIIILFLFVFCGWGDGNGNGFGGGRNGGGANSPAFQGALTRGDLCSEFNFNDLQSGVRGISDSVNSGFSDLNSTICHQQYDTATMVNGLQSAIASGFAGVDNSICTLGYQNAALINGLGQTVQNGFNAANVVAMQNQNALQTQIANCCCENKQLLGDIKYTMATDTCALQNTIQNTTRDLLDNQNANTRAILDYLCQDKIASLTAENQTLKFAASQQAQNAYLVSELSPKLPVPAYQVPNPFVPYGYNNCGCGCGTGYIG